MEIGDEAPPRCGPANHRRTGVRPTDQGGPVVLAISDRHRVVAAQVFLGHQRPFYAIRAGIIVLIPDRADRRISRVAGGGRPQAVDASPVPGVEKPRLQRHSLSGSKHVPLERRHLGET